MFKKISLILLSVFVLGTVASVTIPTTASAIIDPGTGSKTLDNASGSSDSSGSTGTFTTPVFKDERGCYNFGGLISWACNVTISDQDSLKSGIWTIAANIATDITIVAAYLVIGFVIYGGYLYISSSGDPNKVAAGKKTLTQAFIGLAIVMLANVILNSIRAALGVSFTDSTNCATSACANPGTIVTNAIQWVIAVAGIVAAVFVIIGGISYATSSGNPDKLKEAKRTITYALIGLVIVALAEIITAFVSNTIKNAAYTNNITISKEVNEKTT